MTATEALEQLYAVTPKEFTRARNSLAAELRRARNTEAARVVAELRRPSAALWAVNQLARHAHASLERFLDAVEQLRRTQLSDPRAAMDAMRAERSQLEALVVRAGQTLDAAGYAASAEARRRIGDTLLGAATDRRHADALLHGRLTQELQAPGFDALAGGTRLRVVQGGAVREDSKASAAHQARRRAAADARQRERETKAEARHREAETRRREAETRRREATEQAAAVAALEREATAARERLADIQRRLKQARRGRASRAR